MKKKSSIESPFKLMNGRPYVCSRKQESGEQLIYWIFHSICSICNEGNIVYKTSYTQI